jgi:hypothetical protein
MLVIKNIEPYADGTNSMALCHHKENAHIILSAINFVDNELVGLIESICRNDNDSITVEEISLFCNDAQMPKAKMTLAIIDQEGKQVVYTWYEELSCDLLIHITTHTMQYLQKGLDELCD